jgi:hypothetical protein
MPYIVQVFPYLTNNGCSVRIGIGQGLCSTEPLEPRQCTVYRFVETKQEVKDMIKTIQRLPGYYRKKDKSLEKLNQCPWLPEC